MTLLVGEDHGVALQRHLPQRQASFQDEYGDKMNI